MLFLGRTVSVFGNAMAPIALAFAVLDLTGSKADLGIVLAARTLPQVVLLLLGGVWADRLPRHLVMVGSNLLSGATQGGVATLLILHHARIWELIALSAMNGASSAFFFPASAGVVPQTVHASLLQQANAVLRLALNVVSIGGAAVGGFLVAAAGPGWAVAVDAASFVAAAGFIALIQLPQGGRVVATSMFAELSEGWREFRSRTWLWAIVAQFSIVNAAQISAIGVLGPVVAKEHLGGAKAWGAILTCDSAGLLVGGLLMLRLRPQRMLLVATLAMFLVVGPPALLAIPAPAAAIAAAAVAAGIGIETFGILWDTTMQQNIPQDRLSRVYAYDALGSFVFIPIGQAAIGPIAQVAGTRATLLGAVALVGGATLAVLAVADVRNLRRRPDAATA